jgi:hypothetical protein
MMRRTSFAFGAAVALVAAQAVADPTIDTTNAALTTGVAPTSGQVIVDSGAAAAKTPAVPRIEPVGTIGGFSSAMPGALRPFGGGTKFVASGSTTLPGGVHEYASYSVPAGAAVTYDGAATIRVAGDVTILGRVSTNIASLGVLTFEAGGGVTFGPSAVVDAAVFQQVVFDAVGPITASAGAAFSNPSYGSTVKMRARGTQTAASDIRLDGAHFDVGGVFLQASGSVAVSGGSTMQVNAGDVTLQAFGGDVTMSGGSSVRGTSSITFEASGSIRVEGQGAGFQATQADVRMRAFGDGVSIADGASLRLTSGSIDLRALGTVALESVSNTGMTSGSVRLKSFGSDVVVQTGTIVGTALDVDLVAARDVVIDGAGDVVSGLRSVDVAAGRDVVHVDRPTWNSQESLVVLAGRSIVAPHGMRVESPSAVFAAENGAIGFGDLDFDGRYREGGFRAVAFGALSVGGAIAAWGPVDLASRTAEVDVSGCSIKTRALFGARVSSPVSIESFGGAAGRITAVGATIAAGNATETSGDIRLLVHAGEIVEPVEGFLVPTRVAVRRLRTGGTFLTASGFLDTGSASLAPGDATLTIGDAVLPVLLRAGGRNKLWGTGGWFDVDLSLDPNGSSRAAFRVRSYGDLSGFLAADGSGELTLRIASAGATASGAVALTKGAYPSGRVARAAPRSDLYLSRLAGRLPGTRPGTLDATLGIGAAAASASAASRVRVDVGDRFSALVPMSAFVERTPGVLRAVGPAPGVRFVVIDVRAGTIRIVASDADLRTAFGDVPTQLVVGVSIGASERSVRLRVRHSGALVSY